MRIVRVALPIVNHLCFAKLVTMGIIGILFLKFSPILLAQESSSSCNLSIKGIQQINDDTTGFFTCKVEVDTDTDVNPSFILCTVEIDGEKHSFCNEDEIYITSEEKSTFVSMLCSFPSDMDVSEDEKLYLTASWKQKGLESSKACHDAKSPEKSISIQKPKKRTNTDVNTEETDADSTTSTTSTTSTRNNGSNLLIEFLKKLFTGMDMDDENDDYENNSSFSSDDESTDDASFSAKSKDTGLDKQTWKDVTDDTDRYYYSKYGLEEPNTQKINDLQKILKRPNAKWAAQQLLAYEKILKKKGVKIHLYLNTAWLWFENNPSGTGSTFGPDPYLHNCRDETYNTATFCPAPLFQVGGYQAQDRKGDYKNIYQKCFGSEKLGSIMRTVYDNSDKASRTAWEYINKSNEGLIKKYKNSSFKVSSIDEIKPSALFDSEKQQFYYVLTGKHPCMVTGLNSYAVSTLPQDIRTKSWASYVRKNETTLSSMVQALIEFDKENPPEFEAESNREGNEESERSQSKNSSTKNSMELFNQIKKYCDGQILASDCPNGRCPCLDRVDVPGISEEDMQTIKNRIGYSANLASQYALQCVGGAEVFFIADNGREMFSPRLGSAKNGSSRKIDGFTYYKAADRDKFTPGSVCIFTGTTHGHIAYLVENNYIIETNALKKTGGGDLYMRKLTQNTYPGSYLRLDGCHVPN